MARKTNRTYKKGKPHRDFRKFIIVAEGEREDEYFSYFNSINGRVQIETVPRIGGKSAAKFLLERAIEYIDKNGLEKEDFLWFVLDVDKWPRSEIENLKSECDLNINWNISISNPCFEIWLYFHFSDATKLDIKTAKKIKTKLNSLVMGGYNKDFFAKEIIQATKNSKIADDAPDYYYPNLLRTKVYQLSEEMLKFLGHNWK